MLGLELKPSHPVQTNTPSLPEFSEDKGRVEHQRGEGLQRDQVCSRIFGVETSLFCFGVPLGRTLSSPRLDSPKGE